MTGTRLVLPFAALVSVAACGHKPEAAARADSIAVGSKDSAALITASGPSKVEGFQHPESLK